MANALAHRAIFFDGRSRQRSSARALRLAALSVVIFAATLLIQAYAAVPEYSAVVVKSYPHDPAAFTEGLLYDKGHLYESTGRSGQSSVREVNLETGQVLREINLDPQYFGEGIVIWKDRLIQLTWKNEIGFVYDLKTFALRSTFHYPGEGWALTQDGSDLIMSDGTSDLRILDPDNFTEKRRIHVTCDGMTFRNINELEWVKGEIYANVWLTNLIIRINAVSGDVTGLIDLTDLVTSTVKITGDNVLNGIAYDPKGDRLFVTGKLWPKLYQIRLVRRSVDTNLCRSLPAPAS
ncbi:MAG: glutaminyl-peptide cyclotransferase [Acetobacteraceae bacterium]|jgi:glutaminyl-peptide cyclotransferase